MKATEVTEPGYYWVRDANESPVHWYVVEMDLGEFYEIGREPALGIPAGDLYGPILPPRGHALRERRGDL